MSSVFKNTGTSSAALPPAGKGARARRKSKATTKQPRVKQMEELSAISDQLATIGESIQGFSAKVDEFDKGVTKYSQEKDQMKIMKRQTNIPQKGIIISINKWN